MKIFLDDERETPPGWTCVRWPEDVIFHLQNSEVSEISLDHDLGDDNHGTGYDVILWIEEQCATNGYIPPIIHIHSANASARIKMNLGLRSIQKIIQK